MGEGSFHRAQWMLQIKVDSTKHHNGTHNCCRSPIEHLVFFHSVGRLGGEAFAFIDGSTLNCAFVILYVSNLAKGSATIEPAVAAR
jgi:hypothetical protein